MFEVGRHQRRDGGWEGRVAFAGTPDDSFAYIPHEVVVGGQRGLEVARDLFDGGITGTEEVFPQRAERGAGRFVVLRLAAHLDPLLVVRELRVEGVVAQPNHVLFAHPVYGSPVYGSPVYGSPVYGSPVYGSPVYGSPVYGSPVYGSPVYGSPVYGSPVYGSPVYGSPVYGSPVYGSPVYGSASQKTGWRKSSASPSAPPPGPRRQPPTAGTNVRIVVLDTGLAIDRLRPSSLNQIEHPAQDDAWKDEPDPDDDDGLDPAAGHGTFIAGLIDRLAPGCEVMVERVLTSYGDGQEALIANRIDALSDVDLLNLSFGGYTMDDDMQLLGAAVRRIQDRGTVVVASAGNDCTNRPSFPSHFLDVISVAALGPYGPAPFSNFGPWVRACAPGVDLISTFFTDVEGPPPDFDGWACWSGTSFAGPVVVAALAREMQCYGLSGAQAVERVIDAPDLFRIPEFGTVVNLD